MKFAEHVILNTIDYPDHLGFTIFTIGCDMDCIFCHNKSLLTEEKTVDETQMLQMLLERKSFTNYITITGGEPTIQIGLLQFCKTLREHGFKVKLDTNGLHSDVLYDLLNYKCVDYVAMDLKTAVFGYNNPLLFSGYSSTDRVHDRINALIGSISCLCASTIPHEYRTTPIPSICNEQHFQEIARLLKTMYRDPTSRMTWYIQTAKQSNGETFDIYDPDTLDTYTKILQIQNRINIVRRP